MKTIMITCMIIIAVIGSLWCIYVVNIPDINDPYSLMDLAATLHTQGSIRMNHDLYIPYGNRLHEYIMHMPYQSGMILYDWLIMCITGVSMNFLPFQLINSIIIMPVSALLFTLISGELADILKPNDDEHKQNVMKTTIILLTIFTPFSFYSWKIYGNIISMPFTLFAILLIIRLLRTHDENSNVSIKKTIRIILLCFSLFMMAWLKPNTSIMLIALMITLITSIIGKPELFKLIMLILLPLSFTAGYNTPIMIMQNYTDFNLNDNRSPAVSWIAMGTQYNGSKQEAPGAFVQDYYDITFNTDADNANEAMKKQALSNINNMIANNDVMNFIRMKNIWLWSEPSFSTYMRPATNKITWNDETNINQVNVFRKSDLRYKTPDNPDNKVEFTDLQALLMNHYHYYYYIIDAIQTMIILAALTGVILIMKRTNKNDNSEMQACDANSKILLILPLIIITGGFLFHCFWEAMPEYAYTYFLFFIPYASIGLNNADYMKMIRKTIMVFHADKK